MDFTLIAIAGLAAVSVGALFYAFVYPYLSGEVRAEKRMDAFAADAAQRRAGDRMAELNAGRKRSVADSLKELDNRESEKRKLKLRDRIDQAGLEIDEKKFYVISAALALAVGGIIFVLSGNLIAALLGLVVGGAGIPRWALTFLRNRRIKKFVEEFPNAIDIIVRGIKSGLPLGDCLRIIASEATDPLKSEFRAIVEAQTMGLSVGEACSRLFKRMPIQEANFFVIVIQIQQKAGGNLSEALANLSRVLRDRKRMKGKIAAMSMEAKASGVIIAALPFIVGVLVQLSSPGFIKPLFTTQMGHLMLLIAGFWMLCGIIAMKKMISFDI
ncbi:MAG: type II secretion system F family protein [Beijerinckiaceae bacterium]